MQHFISKNLIENDRALSIALIGCGATGGEILDSLFRIHNCLLNLDQDSKGIHVTAYDGDAFQINNIGKQKAYPWDIGKNKAITLIQRYNQFCNTGWLAYDRYCTMSDLNKRSFDLVITAVDNAKFRVELGECWYQLRIEYWLDMGVDENEGQVILGASHDNSYTKKNTNGTYKYLPNVYDLFGLSLKEKAEKEAKKIKSQSCSSLALSLASQSLFINKLCADAAAQIIWTLIRHGRIEHHGAVINSATSEMTPIKINELVWASLGYTY